MSLARRLVLAASLVLAAFLGLTGVALDRAFRETGLEMVRERLLARVYALLAAAELDASGRLVLPADLPDPRLATPAAGVYAQVRDASGETLWRSRSALGTVLEPAPGETPGEPAFAASRTVEGVPVFALSFAVRWETDPDARRLYRFEVAETRATFEAQLARFRESLWGWLAGAAVLLLAVQGAILRWGLAPLARLAAEVREVEAGRRDTVSDAWPAEIRPLALALNALIGTGRRLVERQRDALADLAHSLKTPLAVLRALRVDDPDSRAGLDEQVERMGRTVDYHLRRASGAGALARRIEVAPIAARVRDALLKAHAGRGLDVGVEIEARCTLRGEEGELMEVLGNLLDNACKWARERVRVRVRECAPGEAGGPGLLVEVEDDGPGIDPAQADRILERGVRADERVAGHGIGLAVVREIVVAGYGGELRIDSGPLGGARVRARLGPPL